MAVTWVDAAPGGSTQDRSGCRGGRLEKARGDVSSRSGEDPATSHVGRPASASESPPTSARRSPGVPTVDAPDAESDNTITVAPRHHSNGLNPPKSA